MKHTDKDAWVYGAFSRDAEIPASVEARLRESYDAIRQNSREREKDMKKHMGRSAKTALILAAAVAILTVSALAVYHLSMADRKLLDEPLQQDSSGNDMYLYSATGVSTAAPDASADTDGVVYVASERSPEYLAAEEWFSYFFSDHEEDFDERLPADSPYKTGYDIAWKAVGEKLRAIADKYGLRLHESYQSFDSVGGLCGALGIEPFMELETYYDFGCDGVAYEDGSFMLSAVRTPVTVNGAEEKVAVIVYRAVKGTFNEFHILGGEPEEYEYEAYTTADGMRVDLALGKHYSFLFAELGGCYVTMELSGGSEPVNDLTLLDMAALEQIADGIDFAALA